MDGYKFIYDENISIKGIEPLLNCDNPNFYSSTNNVSNYFYNLYTPYKNNIVIEELDKIFEYSNKVNIIKKYANTINKDSWLKYKISKNITINNISEHIIKSDNIIENISNGISVNYIQNGKSIIMDFESTDLYDCKNKSKPLFNISQNINNTTENILYLRKECYCNNEIEYLYTLLNCLFTSNNNYYIKLCERCNRYFLTTTSNKRMCNRPRTICGELTMCCNASKVFYKSKEYKYMFRIIENHLKPYYEDNMTYSLYIGNIRNEFSKIKEKCIIEDKYDCVNECIDDTKKLISEDISKYL